MAKFRRLSKKEIEDKKALRKIALNVIKSRHELAEKLGLSYGTDRDTYDALGYPKDPDFDEYWGRYIRQDIAATIVNAPADACWESLPVVTENDTEETPFESAWNRLVEEKQVFQFLYRLDKISGIGKYGVLLMGFDDAGDLSTPLKKGRAKTLLYMMPYMERDAQIVSWVTDTKNSRFGLPETYSIDITVAGSAVSKSAIVHHSRCLHVADCLVNNNVSGRPRLENVLNRIHDLEKVVGGSGEGFWRNAFPGLVFNMMEESDIDEDDDDLIKEFQDEIDKYVHKLQRYLRLRGMEVKELVQQVSDPSGCVNVFLDLIAGARGIPKRILIGSERGELASSQDETAWNKRMKKRQRLYCEPSILRPFIDTCIYAGVLPEPPEGYTVNWPSLFEPTDKEKADVSKVKTESIATYVNSQGADIVVPPRVFLSEVMGFSEEMIQKIEDERETLELETDSDEDGEDE